MKQKNPYLIALFFTLFAVPGGIRAQEENSLWVFQDITPGPHQGKINSLHYDGERIISAGEDGFLELWDQEHALVRFQISSLPISAAALRPGTSQIACVETDNLGQYRVSVWDYKTFKNIFTLDFRDPVRNLSYSAGGAYLIIARSGTTGLVLVNSDTGELLLDPRNIPENFPSTISFAVIGRTEQVLLTYSPAGVLSYWDLKMDGELRLVPAYDSSLTFNVPANLESPVLFGNNRFFAGIDQEGLVILRADTGDELARDSSVSLGQLYGLGAELYCLVKTSGEDGILRFRMDNTDRVERREYFPLPAAITVNALLPFSPGSGTAALPRIALGTAEGDLLTAGPRFPLSAVRKLTTRAQTRIPEIAAGAESIAFLTGEGRLGYIPLDFLKLKNGDVIRLEPSSVYTRITAVGSSAAEDRFLLWQDGSPLPLPAFRSEKGDAPFPGLETAQSRPAGIFSRFPLRSVSALEDRGLFLDIRGNVSVLSLPDGAELYSEVFIGAMDAVFIDRDNVVLGHGVSFSQGITAPFLKIDIKTGETVPIPYPVSTGILVYRGASGTVYGVTVEGTENGLQTSIVKLDTREGVNSARLVEYNSEDTRYSLAEVNGFLASTIGGSGAVIYVPGGMIGLERGPGLALSIADGNPYFVVLDAEGCVSWHDPLTGDILAVFRLYEDQWILRTAQASPLWGRVIR
ncbi:MAG: WD40 repeat domain-containing protein [Treponema sp.]|jgi:hypothetical protein|nr:WD40 repeat domain-containing protein [Treponema sp.]